MKKNLLFILIMVMCVLIVDVYFVAGIVYTAIHPEVGLWRIPLLAIAIIPWNVTSLSMIHVITKK